MVGLNIYCLVRSLPPSGYAPLLSSVSSFKSILLSPGTWMWLNLGLLPQSFWCWPGSLLYGASTPLDMLGSLGSLLYSGVPLTLSSSQGPIISVALVRKTGFLSESLSLLLCLDWYLFSRRQNGKAGKKKNHWWTSSKLGSSQTCWLYFLLPKCLFENFISVL